MVVNSAMDTKGFSRVATFAKATAAEEHVERVDDGRNLHFSQGVKGINDIICTI